MIESAMKLTDVHIQHYKSLSSVKVSLHPQVTVLVGPNAAGKSNFVDALRFLRDAAKDSLDHAVVARGGITRIRQSSMGKLSNIKIGINFFQALNTYSQIPGSYILELPSTGGNYQIEQQEDVPFIDIEKLFIEHWKFSSLYPNTLRILTTPDASGELREDGSNWASVIRTARKTVKGKKMLGRVNEMMRVVLPDFQEVKVTTAGSYLVPNFKFGTDKSNTRTFDPVQLSDGTLRIFGILLSLYQNPAPPLIVIEEPEQTVQPGVLAMLAEAFKEVSEKTQIIITTHSPQLIEHFAPENIRVVTMRDGLTDISPIKHSQQEAVRQGLMGLGEFMAAEGLQPESP